MEYTKAEVVSLKAHPEYNERWLQTLIASDPTILGLGELLVKDIERKQPRAGRLDILLRDPEDGTRYTVEIQLGRTDETHIIRTIEYWDIERSRYPNYDHVAVIVAEDITSRFLNVINLLNKSIPLVAVQIRALKVGNALTLDAVKVLDLMPLADDDDDDEIDAGNETDRRFWIDRSSDEILAMCDELVGLINETTGDSFELKYNKHYIGLARNRVADNIVSFIPRREYLIVRAKTERTEELSARLDEADFDQLPYDRRSRTYRLRLSPGEERSHEEPLRQLFAIAAGVPLPNEDDE